MRTLSTNALRSIHSEETGEVWLPLVTLTNSAWAAPVRLVADTNDVTSGGNLYKAFPFQINLPDEEPEAQTVMSWAIDNTDLSLMDEFRSVVGYIDASVSWVLAATPDVVELGPFVLQLRGFNYDADMISGSLQVEPIMDLVFGDLALNPVNAPALF